MTDPATDLAAPGASSISSDGTAANSTSVSPKDAPKDPAPWVQLLQQARNLAQQSVGAANAKAKPPARAEPSWGTRDLVALGLPLLAHALHPSVPGSEDSAAFANSYLAGRQALADRKNQFDQAAYEMARQGDLARAESLLRASQQFESIAAARQAGDTPEPKTAAQPTDSAPQSAPRDPRTFYIPDEVRAATDKAMGLGMPAMQRAENLAGGLDAIDLNGPLSPEYIRSRVSGALAPIEKGRSATVDALRQLEQEYRLLQSSFAIAAQGATPPGFDRKQAMFDLKSALDRNAIQRSTLQSRIGAIDDRTEQFRRAHGQKPVSQLVHEARSALGSGRDPRQVAADFQSATGGRSVWGYLPEPFGS
jgi:hypothetical protein